MTKHYLAPDNVLTSALKLANVAVENLSKEAMSGNKIGGKTYTYGLKENAVEFQLKIKTWIQKFIRQLWQFKTKLRTVK